MKSRRSLLVLGLLLSPLTAAGETVYVTDQLTVGLRADAASEAPVLKTVTTGMKLEVLERSDTQVRVRDPQGDEGWVEATVLSPGPPAVQQLRGVRAELERARAQLAAAQAQSDKDKSRAAGAPDVGKLQSELAGVREQLVQAQAQLEKNQAEMLALAASAQGQGTAPPVESPPPSSSGFSFLWLGIAFAMLVLGFIGGMVWVRESIRRRMGGMYLRI